MRRGKKFTAEQIIGKLHEAEAGLAQGTTVPEVVQKLGRGHFCIAPADGVTSRSMARMTALRRPARRRQIMGSPSRRRPQAQIAWVLCYLISGRST